MREDGCRSIQLLECAIPASCPEGWLTRSLKSYIRYEDKYQKRVLDLATCLSTWEVYVSQKE